MQRSRGKHMGKSFELEEYKEMIHNRILNKYYSKKEKKFHIVYKNPDFKITGIPQIDFITKSFNDFYELINGNLEDVDLREFDFKHVCLKNYDFDGASSTRNSKETWYNNSKLFNANF